MGHDLITLTVPARSDYARTVRMTAAALVGRMDMSYDDVEDVRMAAEEAFVYAVDTFDDDASVVFEFRVGDNEIEISVPLGSKCVSADEPDDAASLAGFILESVCDEHEFATGENGAFLRLVKRAGSADAD
ncbi:MAG: ATP-binding protein [Coriobacteriia bacterium]|nr:ATP-binding protein [Coriobacteriia bacterium]